jgi:hypothetical protein
MPSKITVMESLQAITSLIEDFPCISSDEDNSLEEHLSCLAVDHLALSRDALLAAKKEYSCMLPYRLGRGFWKPEDKAHKKDFKSKPELYREVERLVKESWLEFYLIIKYSYQSDGRIISFVHVPKCFGSKISKDISDSIGSGSIINYNTIRLNPSWIRPWQRINDAKALLPKLRDINTLYISGHFSLVDLRNSGLDRNSTFIFSTIREPHSIIVSHANYIVSCLKNYPSRPDSQNWTRLCNLEGIQVNSMIKIHPDQLAAKIIESEFFAKNYSNLLCKAYAPFDNASPIEIRDHIEADPSCYLYSAETLPDLYSRLGIDIDTKRKVNESDTYINLDSFMSLVDSSKRCALASKDEKVWNTLTSLLGR